MSTEAQIKMLKESDVKTLSKKDIEGLIHNFTMAKVKEGGSYSFASGALGVILGLAISHATPKGRELIIDLLQKSTK